MALCVFMASLFIARPAGAADTMVFDSTSNYLGGCQLTDKSEWELKEDLNVSKFEVWYNWNQGETSLPVKVFFNGEKFAEFEATRGNCDPYQKQWCNADYQINKQFLKGTYSTEIPNKRQCLKPGGTGAIRLYSDSNPVKATNTSPTIIPTITNQTNINGTTVSPPTSCSCSQTTIIVTTVITSIISSALVSIFLRKRLTS